MQQRRLRVDARRRTRRAVRSSASPAIDQATAVAVALGEVELEAEPPRARRTAASRPSSRWTAAWRRWCCRGASRSAARSTRCNRASRAPSADLGARGGATELDPLQRQEGLPRRAADAQHPRHAQCRGARQFTQTVCLGGEHLEVGFGAELDEQRAAVAVPPHAVADAAAADVLRRTGLDPPTRAVRQCDRQAVRLMPRWRRSRHAGNHCASRGSCTSLSSIHRLSGPGKIATSCRYSPDVIRSRLSGGAM